MYFDNFEGLFSKPNYNNALEMEQTQQDRKNGIGIIYTDYDFYIESEDGKRKVENVEE